MSRGACPRCGCDLVPQSANMDGVIWDNEKCSNRQSGCLYETDWRIAFTPIRETCRLHGLALDRVGECPACIHERGC